MNLFGFIVLEVARERTQRIALQVTALAKQSEIGSTCLLWNREKDMSTDDSGLVFHDEIELEDFEWDEESESWTYPCPCGDRFMITPDELEAGEEVATCPSCSLIVKVSPKSKQCPLRLTCLSTFQVIFDPDDIPAPPESQDVKTVSTITKKSTATA